MSICKAGSGISLAGLGQPPNGATKKKKIISIHINKRKKKKIVLRQQYQIWRSHKDINDKN
jgi:hypothetical protein